MHVKRRRLPNFEACSVALFASLVFYGPLPVKAQVGRSAAPVTTAPGADQTSTTIPRHRWACEQPRQPFSKTDVNGDFLLNREEASVWAGLSRRFDQIDTCRDGSISSAGFDEALK